MVEPRFLKDIAWIAEKTKPVTLHGFDSSPYEGRVPPSLIEIWRQFRAASWLDGVFQIFHPALFSPAIDARFARYPLLARGAATPLILSAHGLLHVWRESFATAQVQYPLGRIVLSEHPSRLLTKEQGDIALISHLPTSAGSFATITGYAEDRARLGRLGENEVYGFFPALALGGGSSPDHVQRVQADVHLDFLASLQPFQLLYFDGRGYSPVEQG